MYQKAEYPKRPIRAAAIAFVILSSCFGAAMPWDDDIRSLWPYAFGYSAVLAVASIGLARLGRRVFLLLGVPALVALAPGVVGLVMALRPGASLESGNL